MLRTPAAADQRFELLEGDESVIPDGPYCYRHTGRMKVSPSGGRYPETAPCPYWGSNPQAGDQDYGYCAKLGLSDWEGDGTGYVPTLWDMVKECGVRDGIEEDAEEDEIPA